MQDRREFPEAWDRLVNQARSDQQANQARMEAAARQVQQAVRVYLEALASGERLVRLVPPVRPDPRVQLALLALRDRPAHLAPPVLLAA